MSTLQQLARPSIDDHQILPERYETTGEFSSVCAQIVLDVHVLGKIWTTRIIMVREYSGTKSNKNGTKLVTKES